MLSCNPVSPVKEADSAVSTVSLVAKKLTAWALTRSLAVCDCMSRAMTTSEVL